MMPVVSLNCVQSRTNYFDYFVVAEANQAGQGSSDVSLVIGD